METMTDFELERQKKMAERDKIFAEVNDLKAKEVKERDGVLIEKVETLRLVLMSMRLETPESRVIGAENVAYVPILNEDGRDVVAGKLIELVKKF